MISPRRFATSAAIAIALALPGAAVAGSASFGISPGSMVGDTGATVMGGGVALPDTSAPRVFFTFILPRDYAKNTPVKLVAAFHSVVPSCSFVLLNDAVVQRRPNVTADADKSVLVPKGGSNVIEASSSIAIPFQQTFVLSPGGTIAGMRPGDQFMIAWLRSSADPQDTCAGQVFLEAIDVRYSTV